jgi:hypothetical protein
MPLLGSLPSSKHTLIVLKHNPTIQHGIESPAQARYQHTRVHSTRERHSRSSTHLHGCAVGNGFIWVDALVYLLALKVLINSV